MCGISTQEIAIISIIIVSVLILLFIVSLSKSISTEKKSIDGKTKTFNVEEANIKIKEKFLFQKEIKVLDIFVKNFSTKYLIVPKVALKNFIAPKSSKIFFNSISGKIVDFVFFDKINLNPVLVVDIFDNTMGDESIKEIDKDLVTALKVVSLPLISIQIKDDILEKDILPEITSILEPAVKSINGEIKTVEDLKII